MGSAGGEVGDNVYVTGLPSSVDETTVRRIFSTYGAISRCKVLPVPSAGAKGAALVQFQSPQEASWVVANLNGTTPTGLTESVTVRYANKPGGKGVPSTAAVVYPPSGTDDGYGKAGGAAAVSSTRPSPYGASAPVAASAPQVPNDNLYVTGLPPNLDNDLLKQFFSAYGTVKQCKVLPSRQGATTSVALVRFGSITEASMVKEQLDGHVPPTMSEPLRLNYATSSTTPMAPAGVEVVPSSGKAVGKGPTAAVGKGKGRFSINALLSGFEKTGAIPGASFAHDDKAVYVAGLPIDCEDIHLYQLFAPFGPIAQKGIRAMKNPDGSCKGFGFINYLLAESAHAAIAIFNGCELPDGTIMKAAIKRDKSGGVTGAVVPAPGGFGFGGAGAPGRPGDWSGGAGAPQVIDQTPTDAAGNDLPVQLELLQGSSWDSSWGAGGEHVEAAAAEVAAGIGLEPA